MQNNEHIQDDTVPRQGGYPANGTMLSQTEQQLAEEQRKADEYLDLLRRSQADFINYKRRASQEQGEARIVGQAEVLTQLLPVLDDLGRALRSAPPELSTTPWVQGLILVSKRLITTLEQLDVRQIGKPGDPFDPRWHEAVTLETRSDVPEGTILTVTQPGYALGERVLRPAQVIVSSTPPATQI
ncbi:MAG TPA: nucleotide exchange factor GrpE [Ktedonobacteraceae bacterium]|nr:nucleotide exchange factor GrpE [Ktedonobacteraceae bacterium]